MNIFEQFEAIDKQVSEIKEHNRYKNEQFQIIGQSSEGIGGMGFGTLHQNGAITTGFVDGQLISLYNSGPMTTGTIGGETISVYTDGTNTIMY